MADDFSKELTFEWDEGNETKNWIKHNVTKEEAEKVFTDRNSLVSQDLKHSEKELRWLLIGEVADRLLAIFFTIRRGKVRIISARPASKKERELYESTEK